MYEKYLESSIIDQMEGQFLLNFFIENMLVPHILNKPIQDNVHFDP